MFLCEIAQRNIANHSEKRAILMRRGCWHHRKAREGMPKIHNIYFHFHPRGHKRRGWLVERGSLSIYAKEEKCFFAQKENETFLEEGIVREGQQRTRMKIQKKETW